MSIYREDEFLKNTIKKIALKYHITYFQAYDIYHSRWALARKTLDTIDIEHNYFPVATLPHLAKFGLRVKRKRELVEKYTKWARVHKPKINKDETTAESIKDRERDSE